MVAALGGRRVGVDDLDMVLGGGSVGLEVGVEDLAVDLERGVVDLEGPADLVVAVLVVDLVVEPVGLVGLDAVGVSLDELVDLLIGGVGLVVEMSNGLHNHGLPMTNSNWTDQIRPKFLSCPIG